MRIHGTKVTDEGMPNLTGMAKFEALMFHDTAVTEKGLSNLKSPKQLKEIDLGTLGAVLDVSLPAEQVPQGF